MLVELLQQCYNAPRIAIVADIPNQVNRVIILPSWEYTSSTSGHWTFYFFQHKISIQKKSNTTKDEDYNSITLRRIPFEALYQSAMIW